MSTADNAASTMSPAPGAMAFHEIAPLTLKVHDAPSLDVLGRALSSAVADDAMTREQAGLLLLEAIPKSSIIRQVMRSRLQMYAVQGHGDEIETRVLDRLREKVEQVRPDGKPFLDWALLADRSTSAWVRGMSRLLVGDATRAMVRSGEMFTGSTEDLCASQREAQPVPPASTVWEMDRQMDVVDSYEDATTDARGRKRRLTPVARIHLNAQHLREINQWPAPSRPLTWAERERVRALLEEDPQITTKSLRGGEQDVPEALEAMWDPFDEAQRQLLMRRPEQALMLALAAVTPFPRPRRDATINAFRRSVSALSKDVQWRRTDARHLADAWLGVFLDLATFQSRGSAATMEERESAAKEGRTAWDVMMGENRTPARLQQIARTSTDLCELLVDLWEATINDPAERAIERSHELGKQTR